MMILAAVTRRFPAAVVAAVAMAAVVVIPSAGSAVALPHAVVARALGGQVAGFDFGIEPYSEPGAPKRSEFDLDAAVGATITDRVEIVNAGSTSQEFYIYPAGAYTIEDGGGFGVSTRNEARADLASWITLPVDMYIVPARTGSVIPFRLSIPSDATPGDHTAAIVAEQVLTPAQVKSGAGVAVIHRVAARVYLRVDGPVRPALHVESFVVSHKLPTNPLSARHTKTGVTFVVENTGNVRVALSTITVAVDGLFGRSLHRITLTTPVPGHFTAPTQLLPSQILPGDQIQLVAPFTGLPIFDHVSIRLSVKGADAVSQAAVTTKATSAFWVVPWLALAVLAGLVICFVGARRCYRRGDKADPVAPTSAPESRSTALREPVVR